MGLIRKDEFVMAEALELTGKFGFLPRAIVWKYLTPEGVASKYHYWQRLKNSPQFAVYKSGLSSPHHLTLSQESRKLLGGSYVANRSATYFEHDEFLMDIALQLKNENLISQYLTEQELRMDRVSALKILGGSPDDKIPDLVIDISGSAPVRIAVEVERTRKSQSRYRRIQSGYSRLRKVDLVLFGVCDSATEQAIKSEFERFAGGSKSLASGFFDLKKFAVEGFATELRIQGKTLKLGAFLKNLASANAAVGSSGVSKDLENHWNPFQVKIAKREGVAKIKGK